jgi:hypothetical protein
MASKPSAKEIEFHPDAWKRFERAAAVVAKSPPQHRSKSEKPAKRQVKRKRAASVKPAKRKPSS